MPRGKLKCDCGAAYTPGKPPAVVAGKRPLSEIRADIEALMAEVKALSAEEPATFDCLMCGAELSCAEEVKAWRQVLEKAAALEAAAADKQAAEAAEEGTDASENK
jgi:hypothetical protein